MRSLAKGIGASLGEIRGPAKRRVSFGERDAAPHAEPDERLDRRRRVARLREGTPQ